MSPTSLNVLDYFYTATNAEEIIDTDNGTNDSTLAINSYDVTNNHNWKNPTTVSLHMHDATSQDNAVTNVTHDHDVSTKCPLHHLFREFSS